MKLRFFCQTVVVMAGIVSTSILFTACTKTVDQTPNRSNSSIMAINLVPDKSVIVAVAGSPLSSVPMPFTSYTGSYASIYSGNWQVQSISYDSLTTVLDSSSYNFLPQKFYSVFATGINGQYHNVITWDNFDSLSGSSGQAYIRYINAISDSSAPLVTIAANGNNVVNNNAPFDSVSNFTAITPGAVNIQVNNGGSINLNRTITLDPQKAYTVLLAGIPDSTGTDSLQIRYVVNGMLQQKTHAGSSTGSSVLTR